MTGKAAFGVGSREIHGEGDLVINQPPSSHRSRQSLLETIDAFALWMIRDYEERVFFFFFFFYVIKVNIEDECARFLHVYYLIIDLSIY